MTDKMLGQVAMETFASLIRTDGSYPGWAGHTPDSKEAWQAAAQAVLAEAERLTPQECAVIEAAEAQHAAHLKYSVLQEPEAALAFAEACIATNDAVRALQEALDE